MEPEQGWYNLKSTFQSALGLWRVSGGVIFMSVGQKLAELLKAIPHNTAISPSGPKG